MPELQKTELKVVKGKFETAPLMCLYIYYNYVKLLILSFCMFLSILEMELKIQDFFIVIPHCTVERNVL